MHLTVTCPECEGEKRIMPADTPELTKAQAELSCLRTRYYHAKAALEACDDPFAECSLLHADYAPTQADVDELHIAVNNKRSEVNGLASQWQECPKCKNSNTGMSSGIVSVPTTLETVLEFIVLELARLDKEQTGGESNAARIYQALEIERV